MNVEFQRMISLAIAGNASDIYLAAERKCFFRMDGKMEACDAVFSLEEVESILEEILSPQQRERFSAEWELDFSWETQGRRFRGNVFMAGGKPSVVLRLVPNRIPSLQEIGAGAVFQRLLQAEHGLVLVTGRTGSGKSTTIASYLEAITLQKPIHVITLEDPVEYVHPPKHAFISQRELGTDFHSFPQALRSALREMPDIIMVGELRDPETVRTALMAAESGILVLGTLHSKSVAEAAMRVEGMFQASERDSVRDQLAGCVTAILSQMLVPLASGGRTACMEVLLATDAVRNILRQGKYSQLASVMMSGRSLGMQTMEAGMQALWQSGKVSRAVGMEEVFF